MPRVCRLLAANPGPFTFKGTGVYIVGARDVIVIDPGPDIPEHVAALRHALTGKRISHILVTHTHSDHSPAARPLKEWSGALIYAFGPNHVRDDEGGVRAEEGNDYAFVPDIRVKDGDLLEGDGFTMECVFTPGHTSNHMCYALKEERVLFTGDHVMGWSTSVVVPPDGDMAAYRASLSRLFARNDRMFLPTHGGPVHDPHALVQALLTHRTEREKQILDCLGAGVSRIPEIVEHLYADVDKRLHPAACMSVLAHLIELTGRNRVVAEPAAALSADYRLHA